MAPPRRVAHYRDRRRSFVIILGCKQPSLGRRQLKELKVVAGHIGSAHHLCGIIGAGALGERRSVTAARQHRRKLLEVAGGCIVKRLVLLGRKNRVVAVIGHAAIHAAVIFAAHAVQTFRICHRQLAQQYRMGQGEDGRVRSDAESDGHNRRDGETRRTLQLP